MTTPTDKLDGLLHQARTAAQKLADELEYALELLREEESIEIDVQQLTLDWNRARTELAMAVYGTSTFPDGGLDACAKVIADRRRYGDLEAEVARAQSELRYLEQSPAGLVQELTALIASKREQVELLAAELAEITPPSAPAPPAPAPPPLPEPAPVAMPPKPDRCDVCAERQDHLESSGDHWSCTECLCLEKEVDSARKRLESWGARSLDQSVPSTSELPGVAAVRAEGREAMYALASRRSAAQAAKRAPQQVRRPAKPATSGGTTPPSVDDLRLRWNAHN